MKESSPPFTMLSQAPHARQASPACRSEMGLWAARRSLWIQQSRGRLSTSLFWSQSFA